jgi:hypothetical protein
MQKQFTHLLLTRFNTAINFAPSTINFAPSTQRLEADWLNARLAMFEQYCFPSVAGQKKADFLWLVFFDAASPQWFKKKISAFEPLVRPIYIDGPATDEVIACRIAQTGVVSSPYLVTTRLDNDDAISTDHLAAVQNAFHRQEREFITFPFGLQLFRGHLYNVYWPSNAFLSLIEKVGNNGQVTTVLCVRHDRIGREHKVRQIRGGPKWLQLLHDSNMGNVLRGWPRLNSRSHRRFNVIWPGQLGYDSVGRRIRFSLQAYTARADRLIKKLLAT